MNKMLIVLLVCNLIMLSLGWSNIREQWAPAPARFHGNQRPWDNSPWAQHRTNLLNNRPRVDTSPWAGHRANILNRRWGR